MHGAPIDVGDVFARLYDVFAGITVTQGSLADHLLGLAEIIGIIGTVSSVLLLVGIVYVRIRTHQVEHHGFHVREEKEHALHAATEHVAYMPKNARWDGVAALASSANEGDWRRAILEADSMLDTLLIDRGYAGETLGDRLKSAEFQTINLAWEAHRVRNAIAHLGEAFPLTERDVQVTIDQYRRVFEEFNYI